MARTAMTELQQQIEAVRREAFAAGYGAAMQAIQELASRPAPNAGIATLRRRGGAGRRRPTTTRATATATRRRRAGANEDAARRRSSAAGRTERGANAQRIEEILKNSAPRALRMAEIRKALRQKGIEISFTSVRHALSQLETRSAAEQVGNSKTWQHHGGAP